MPLVSLATDFGDASPYVAMLKGRLLSLCPEARLVDLTHQLPGEDLFGAALFLRRACFYYPAGTVHLIGLDRGNGPDRALVAEAAGQRFVAMDTGVLGLALEHARDVTVRAVEVVNRGPFTARDVLARLALGQGGEGVRCEDWTRLRLPVEPQVIHVDDYGNLISNVLPGEPMVGEVWVGGCRITAHHGHFGCARVGEVFWYWGAEGWLEIGLARGSAAARLGAGRGTPVEVR